MRFITALAFGASLLISAHASAQPTADGIDINRADATAIADALEGVGPARAEAIVRYREANGPFHVLEDLDAVEGIGPRTLERNRDRIHFGAP